MVLWVRGRHPRRAVSFVSPAVPGWLATAMVKTVVEGPVSKVWPYSGICRRRARTASPAPIGAGVACPVVLVFCWPRGAVVRVAGIVLGVGFVMEPGVPGGASPRTFSGRSR